MTTLSLPQIAGHDLLTHSRLTCRKTCGKKHYIKYVLGYRKEATAAPLRLGSAVHVGLDMRNKGMAEADAIALACAGYPDLIAQAQTPEYASELAVECEVVARLLAGYFWRWQVGEADPHVARVIASEQAFDIPIVNPETGKPTPTFRFAGKIDGIVELRDGRIAVMEHKTTGDSIDTGSPYWARLDIDQQISGYFVAAAELGHPVETVLYDVIKKPGIRPRKVTKAEAKKWQETGTYHDEKFDQPGDNITEGMIETPAMYGARLAWDIAADPDKYYARREIPRLKSDLDEFRQELWDMQRDMAEAIRHDRHFRNTAACVGFGTCEYLPICRNGIDPDSPPSGFVRVSHLHPELVGDDDQ